MRVTFISVNFVTQLPLPVMKCTHVLRIMYPVHVYIKLSALKRCMI